MLCGTKISASKTTLKDVKRTDYYGTLNVDKDSTTLDAVFVLLTVLLDGLISEFHAKNLKATEEELDTLSPSELNA